MTVVTDSAGRAVHEFETYWRCPSGHRLEAWATFDNTTFSFVTHGDGWDGCPGDDCENAAPIDTELIRMWISIYKQADAALFAEPSNNRQKFQEQNAQRENDMTTVTAIRDLDIIDIATEIAAEATTTCACGASAVVSDEERDSCLTCAIHEWTQPVEVVSAAPSYEERVCVECGGVYAVLADAQTHCGLCVEAMTPEEYEATAMATADISRDGLIQGSAKSALYVDSSYQEYGSTASTEYIVQDVGDDPDYLYDVDDLHGVPVDRAEDTDLSRAVTRLLGAEDLAAGMSGPYHRDQCVLCEDVEYGTPGCPGIAG